MENYYIAPLMCLAFISCTQTDMVVTDTDKSAIQAAPDEYSAYPAAVQAEFVKCGVDEDEFYSLMGLSYRDFDQDFNGGWRAISYKDGCKGAAENMLKSYLTLQEYQYKSDRRTLMWHTGQVLAGQDKYDEALRYFKQTYKTGDHSTDWNLYVDGTLAFLQKDKDALLKARDTLANMPVSEKVKEARRKFLKDNPNITMPEGFVDEPQNLSVMNTLIACFDEPYSVAYGKCEK